MNNESPSDRLPVRPIAAMALRECLGFHRIGDDPGRELSAINAEVAKFLRGGDKD